MAGTGETDRRVQIGNGTVGPEEQVLEYRKVLRAEVRSHRRFARIGITTGAGLLVLGIAIAYLYAPLAWLLAIVGLLRIVNSTFDLQREDELQRILRRLDERFGREEK